MKSLQQWSGVKKFPRKHLIWLEKSNNLLHWNFSEITVWSVLEESVGKVIENSEGKWLTIEVQYENFWENEKKNFDVSLKMVNQNVEIKWNNRNKEQ